MTVKIMLAKLKQEGVQLSVRDGGLVVRGNRRLLADPVVTAQLAEHKAALIEMIESGEYAALQAEESAAGGIPPGCTQIVPSMLPMLELDQASIDRIVARVAGGAANVEDIYPLAPLQEGILYHHLAARQGDPYLLHAMFRMTDREQVTAFAAALRKVIARHAILRTAIEWEGLVEPVQVVWREVPLELEEIVIDAAQDELASALHARLNPRSERLLSINQAPLMRLAFAEDATSGRCAAILLFHHLILDHVALEVVQAELLMHLAGKAALLAPTVPFRDHVNRTRSAAARAGDEAFFREMLSDIDEPTLPLGLDNVQGDGGGIDELSLRLDASLSRRLRAQARRIGVGAASLHHLAWARVIGCLANRQEVVFGTVLLGRMQGGRRMEHALGLFINTLPVRITVGEQGVQDAVRLTHERLTALLGHEHASLALAQRCSGVAAPQPLFSALLNYRHSASVAEGGLPAASDIEMLEVEERTNYPLLLSVDDLGEDFALTVQCMKEVSAARVAAYMATALESLAQMLEADDNRPAHELAVVPEDERRAVVEQGRGSDTLYPRDEPIHAVFERIALQTPEAVAVEHNDEQIDYAGLNAYANRLAHLLREKGVQPGDRVALLLARSIGLIAAQLAILKCGAAYVPLDRHVPAERLQFLLEDTAAKVLLTDADAQVPAWPGLRIDLESLALDERPVADMPAAVGGDAAAYVMYTSGSTGLPKGVVVPHRAIARLVMHNGYASFDADDRFAFASNPAFDASTLDVWAPLLNGGRIVVIDQSTLLDPPRFGEVLRARRITALFLTTGLFHQYAARLVDTFAQLRYLIVGGDVLDPAVTEHVLRHGAPAHLLNGYGPTEATTFTTTYEVTDLDSGSAIPIGRPFSNTSVYFLDAQGVPVPVGAVGEMYVGGDGVALGYLNRPELSAERFLDDPFRGTPGARMYRTGDLGRYRPDGQIEYLGRKDRQVKLRGFRIELGEIEAHLLRYDGVREAAVLLRDDAAGDKRLVAYVSGDAALEVGALREHLRANLPAYMVPVAYVQMDALPLTINGKLDRSALPAPDLDAFGIDQYEAPEGAAEIALAAIWQHLLGISRVGRRDDFFELGGQSIKAVQLISQVRERLGGELGLAELFAAPRLSDMALAIARAERSDQRPIEKADRTAPLPLSFAQQRMWFLAQMDGGSEAYHISTALRFHGRLDETALRRALDRIVARHEVLRTRFVSIDGMPVQRIDAEDCGFPLEVVAFDGPLPDAEAVARLAEEGVSVPFDLSRGPLIRARLLRLAEQDHVLTVMMHHIVSDGWSMGVFASELGALYDACVRGEDDGLPRLPIQYADYAVWQRRLLEGEPARQQGDYWRAALAGAPECLTLPTDRPRPAKQDYRGEMLEVCLGRDLSRALQALSRRHGVTLYMTLLAGWAALLGRLAGQDDVVVGSPLAGRDRREVEALIGLFVNTLALRVDLGDQPCVSTLLERTKAQVLAAQMHHDLPFEQVVELVQPARSLAHSPLFQVMFVWQNTPPGEVALPGLKLVPVPLAQTTAQVDLSLSLHEGDAGIVGSLSFATALFERGTIERFVGYWKALLQGMAQADGAQPVAGLEILSAAEREHVLHGLNATHRPYPETQTLHGLVEAQVARTPDALAVMAGEVGLSYRELNARANQLAHRLIELGVGPDERVALCVERGAGMVIGLLGILKAGAGYVPLDPSYPAQRLAWMLEDCAPAVVLVQSDTREAVAGACVPVLDLDDTEIGAQPAHDPCVAVQPHHLAYVIYTSGSTGLPKGVMNEHGGVVNRLWWAQRTYGLTAEDRVLQ
ncbi:amino acid adenylation domain-containing protein, partial [Pseudomonas entomophila]|uniref:non-ribosomal peptide synthetase n=1 Tax=Pseudomonas entomophila TaxID=312306 RepID=UPI0023D84930